MEQGGKPVISARNLCKQYVTYKRSASLRDTLKSLVKRDKVVVDAVRDVGFTIGEGEIVGLLGENGAGKSTIIKMLTGVLFPSSGQVDVLGFEPFSQRSRYVQHIGAVFGQKSQLIWDIPPLDSYLLNKAIYDVADAPYKARLDEMIALLGIGEVVQKPTRVLSLGERMKCEFVMAMLHGPRVVFLDEPTIGVDIIAKEAIRTFIHGMNRQGVTFILTTHDLEDVERLAHRVIVVTHGQKVFDDSLDALKRYLGAQKTVHVVMKNAVDRPFTSTDGISITKSGSDGTLELLVDLDKFTVGALIAYLSGLGELKDISIKEPGIEAVIKAIYQSEPARP